MRPIHPRLVRNARATRVHLVLSVLLGVVAAVLVLGQAQVLASAIARAFRNGDGVAEVRSALTVLALIIVARAAVVWLQARASQWAAAAVKSQLRREVMERAAALGTRPDAARTRAEVATLVTRGLDALDDYFGRYLPQLVLAVLIPAVVLGRMLPVDLTAGLTVALTLPLIPVFMVLVGMATEAANRRRWRALNRLGHHFLDVLAGLPTLKVFGRARAQAQLVAETSDRYRSATMGTLRIAFLSSLVLELLATLSVALVAVGVGLRLVNGSLGLETGLLLIILAPEAYLPVRTVGAQYHAAAEGLAAAEEAFELLDIPLPPAGSGAQLPTFPDQPGAVMVRVEGVSVAHSGRRAPAPDGVSLELCRNRITLVTGPSGSGKTTLLGVLLGLVTPSAGSVTLVGERSGELSGEPVALSDLDPAVWHVAVAWVGQNPYLFAGTVAENVRLAHPGASDVEVGQALEAVGLGAVEVHRRVGERGEGLSAGERRRVALARAVVRDAPVVMLDEPTAGLDAETEAQVLEVIERLAPGRAVLLVSHRPATERIAHTVVRLDDPASTTDLVSESDAATPVDVGDAVGVARVVRTAMRPQP